jgi:hypothetical protein
VPRASASWILALALAGAALPVTASADDVLEMRRVTELYQNDGQLVHRGEETGRVYLGARRARFDQGDHYSWILLEAEGKLLLLRHDEATYQELRLPVRLEDYVSEERRRGIAALERRAAPRMVLRRTDEEREIGGWRGRKTVLAGSPLEGGESYEYELWLAHTPVDARLYGELTWSFGALNLILRGTAALMAGLGGFPVLRRSIVRSSASFEVDSRTLVSVESREVPDSVYSPPADYQLIPFDVEEWLHLE